jgi:hypothetical protein
MKLNIGISDGTTRYALSWKVTGSSPVEVDFLN